MITIRNATLYDLPAIIAIQEQCYGDYLMLESSASFHSKIAATAATCWVALRNDETLGYLITLPVSNATFPALNAPVFEICAQPELLYIHDLAIAPAARALGLGKLLLARALHTANANEIPAAGLIAVQASTDYWSGHGFVQVDARARGLLKKVASFGNDACYMERDINREFAKRNTRRS